MLRFGLHQILPARVQVRAAAPRTPLLPEDRGRRLRVPLPNWLPKQALGRIRWSLLGFTLFSIAATWPALLWGSSSVPELRGPGVAAGVVLAALLIRGYRRARFPLKSVLLEFVAYLVLAVSVPAPVQILGVLFPAANFRGMYGSKRDLVAAVLALILGCLARPLILERLTLPSALGAVGPVLIGLPLTALMMYALATNGRPPENERWLGPVPSLWLRPRGTRPPRPSWLQRSRCSLAPVWSSVG